MPLRSAVIGSSPRLWGTRKIAAPVDSVWRFIPTPVGNTTRKALAHALRTVHPHACGEHDIAATRELRSIGSSPRLWGTLTSCRCMPHPVRFIPTPVGNTPLFSRSPVQSSVHPHACGEHIFIISIIAAKLGSSPRLWGTQLSPSSREIPIRFIPTPVGNTPATHTPRFSSAVHPHACGEHSSQIYC